MSFDFLLRFVLYFELYRARLGSGSECEVESAISYIAKKPPAGQVRSSWNRRKEGGRRRHHMFVTDNGEW